MSDNDEPMLEGKLDAAARLLRHEVPVRDAWREELLASIAAEERIPSIRPGSRSPRLWSIRPSVAIAAGISLIAVGAAGAHIAKEIRGAGAPSPVTVEQRVAARPGESVVRFICVAPDARSVSVVGDFDGWAPGALPLHRLADGRTWIAELPLAPGRYAYAFSVDGVLRADPTAAHGPDDDFGVANSVMMVRGL